MNNEMNISEVISELDRISSLYNQHQSLHASMNSVVGEKKAEDDSFSEEIVMTLKRFRWEKDREFSAKRPSIAPACLVPPPRSPKKPNTSNPAKDIFTGAISGLAILGAFLFFVILYALSRNSEITSGITSGITIGMLVLFLATATWFLSGAYKVTMFVDWQKEQKEWEEKRKEWETNFNKSATKEENERFLNEFKEYDTCFLNLVEVCSQKYAEEIKRYEAGLEAIKEKYLNKLDQIHNELSEVSEQLDNVTLIHSDLFKNAWRISSMLKTGRADSLKEAINLALDEDRKDMEEAARRAEARQQEAILEQQAMDNRMHNAAMQRAAEEDARTTRAHNAAMEKAAQAQAQAAQAQAREAARQSEIAQKQARDAQKAASARCARCVNNLKCSYHAKQNAGSCGAYSPK